MREYSPTVADYSRSLPTYVHTYAPGKHVRTATLRPPVLCHVAADELMGTTDKQTRNHAMNWCKLKLFPAKSCKNRFDCLCGLHAGRPTKSQPCKAMASTPSWTRRRARSQNFDPGSCVGNTWVVRENCAEWFREIAPSLGPGNLKWHKRSKRRSLSRSERPQNQGLSANTSLYACRSRQCGAWAQRLA